MPTPNPPQPPRTGGRYILRNGAYDLMERTRTQAEVAEAKAAKTAEKTAPEPSAPDTRKQTR